MDDFNRDMSAFPGETPREAADRRRKEHRKAALAHRAERTRVRFLQAIMLGKITVSEGYPSLSESVWP